MIMKIKSMIMRRVMVMEMVMMYARYFVSLPSFFNPTSASNSTFSGSSDWS